MLTQMKLKLFACCGGECGDILFDGGFKPSLPPELRDKILASGRKGFELELICLRVTEYNLEDEFEPCEPAYIEDDDADECDPFEDDEI